MVTGYLAASDGMIEHFVYFTPEAYPVQFAMTTLVEVLLQTAFTHPVIVALERRYNRIKSALQLIPREDTLNFSKFPAPPNKLMVRLYGWGLGRLLGGTILLLTTTGRKSGLKRVTPLQYEKVKETFMVGSAYGTSADWLRNIKADPRVEVQVGSRVFCAAAELVTDPEKVADFLQLRLDRHPRMVGGILAMEGLTYKPNRARLIDYGAKLALVLLRPFAYQLPETGV